MTVLSLISEHKKIIVTAWMANALDVYPADSRRFFGNKKDSFDNPVGHTLKEELARFVDGLADGSDAETLANHLTSTLRIRAVQEMRPAVALRFLFALKRVLRDTLGDSLRETGGVWDKVDDQIDQAAPFVFEIYAKHREKVFEVRISDVKRQVAHLLKRSAFFTNHDDAYSNEEIGPIEPKPRRVEAPKRGSR